MSHEQQQTEVIKEGMGAGGGVGWGGGVEVRAGVRNPHYSANGWNAAREGLSCVQTLGVNVVKVSLSCGC